MYGCSDASASLLVGPGSAVLQLGTPTGSVSRGRTVPDDHPPCGPGKAKSGSGNEERETHVGTIAR